MKIFLFTMSKSSFRKVSCPPNRIHCVFIVPKRFVGIPVGSDGKESTCNAQDLGLIPGLGRSPGGGPGNPLQYSWWKTPIKEESHGSSAAHGSQRVRQDSNEAAAAGSLRVTSLVAPQDPLTRGPFRLVSGCSLSHLCYCCFGLC